jgi:hypothetical protein
MADPDHIAQLMKGVTTWNAWLDENPMVPIARHGIKQGRMWSPFLLPPLSIDKLLFSFRASAGDMERVCVIATAGYHLTVVAALVGMGDGLLRRRKGSADLARCDLGVTEVGAIGQHGSNAWPPLPSVTPHAGPESPQRGDPAG